MALAANGSRRGRLDDTAVHSPVSDLGADSSKRGGPDPAACRAQRGIVARPRVETNVVEETDNGLAAEHTAAPGDDTTRR